MTISMPVGPVADGVAEEYDWDAESGFNLGGDLPEWRLVVAPARGIFHAPLVTTEPTRVTSEPTSVTSEPAPVTSEPAPVTSEPAPVTSQDAGGTELGHIEARHDRQPIVAPWRGSVIEWLVQDGDPVGLGQPVARLLPDDAIAIDGA
jgi:multidrug efflux pump subunit AcrA (membrane-fusion protein)